MINLSTKFGVSISKSNKNIKGDTKCRKWGGLGSWDHSMSLEIAQFDRTHTSSY